MNYETIEYDVKDSIAFLKLNRPESMNSFTVAMHIEVREALTRAAESKSVRCVLITGNGRGFCAGQDLKERMVGSNEAMPDLAHSVETYYNPLILQITSMQKPVICAVNGVAAGAGASIALSCDIVFAARSSYFIESFAKLGLIPDSGGSWFLPRLVGMARAKAIVMLGPKISAQQAEDWGLIWKSVEDNELISTSIATAKTLANMPTLGFGLTKQAFIASTSNSLQQQLKLERDLMGIAGRTSDYREGILSFMESRRTNESTR